ncbi:PREDICTED: probable E3 ubiquitin-protein ligase RNF217 [Camelina sativa]|uniref:RBR-type E3 ubiquitin transferase n=1 Tax=Camelina sativa TaxID=90675 RepID=A0ABM0T0W4_CAMSA|nr:PREDICTED: probable E3 ubiquitin-protein ligase RNF217 [Camelina sativa]
MHLETSSKLNSQNKMNDGSSSSSSSPKMDTDVLVDETYFSALFDYDDVFPISDENYATELYLQEALFSSLVASTVGVNHHHPQVQMNLVTRVKQEPPEIKIEEDPIEPSSRMFCMDQKPSSDIFRGTTNCAHSYCTDCTVRYVATKIKDNAARIKCPDLECTSLIEPHTCRDLIPKDVFDRWEKILCESLISSWDKFYCPFKDCSAMMVNDGGGDANVTQTECPSCHRLFCVQCKVTWHAGIGCEEFQKYGNTKKKSSDEEDALLVQMAKNKQWRRCPQCKYYVDKVDGCLHINCRCGFQFCYGCGSAWVSSHACHIRT